jgi:hypothetical protein
MEDIFLGRAKQLADARDLVRDDENYASATALLSIHTAIALNDALLLRLTGKLFMGADHMSAVQETAKRCRTKRLDGSGVAQLKALISAKTSVSYAAETVTFINAFKLSVASRRFETWVYDRLKEAK